MEESPVVVHMADIDPLSIGSKSAVVFQENFDFMEEAFNDPGLIQETKTSFSEMVQKSDTEQL